MNEIVDGVIDATTQTENMHNDSLLIRIYDRKENVLMYPEFSELGVTYGPSPDGIHYPRDIGDFLFDICAWEGSRYVAEKCTGLRDGVGKLIYENDEFVIEKDRWRIIYIERNASFFALNLNDDRVVGLNDPLININEIVVCGNIHKN